MLIRLNFLKYSKILIKHIDKRDIYEIVESVYYEFIQSLTSQQLYNKKKIMYLHGKQL